MSVMNSYPGRHKRSTSLRERINERAEARRARRRTAIARDAIVYAYVFGGTDQMEWAESRLAADRRGPVTL